jgi:diacylglycerol kinase family enzyme
MLSLYGIPYDLYITKDEGHLRQLAVECAAKYKRMVAVGGDTTYKIVAKELLALPVSPKHPRPILGMLGTGSANDVVRSLGTFNVEDLCKALVGDMTGHMNVGRIEILGSGHRELFLGAVCLGLGTAVNLFIDSFSKRHPYLAKTDTIGQGLAGVMAVRRAFREEQVPMTATLSWEQEAREVRFSLMAFLNVPFFASGMLMVPGQSPFLRILDTVVINTPTLSNTLGVAMSTARGNHLTRKEVDIITAGAFRLTAPAGETMDIQVDGDVILGIPGFEVSLIPETLEVFTTENVDHKFDS